MNKITLALISLFFFLLSCRNDDNLIQFKALDKSLLNASSLITQEKKRVYNDLEDKLKDPQTKAKAEIWQPKAQQVKQLCSNIGSYIDSLKIALRKEARLAIQNGVEVYDENDKDAVRHVCCVSLSPWFKKKINSLHTIHPILTCTSGCAAPGAFSSRG